MIRKFLLASLTLVSLQASHYKVNLVLDENTNAYINAIKNEANELLGSYDEVKYQIKVCKSECEKLALEKSNSIFIFKLNKKLQENKNSYILTYSNISSSYNESVLIRSSALAIYEFIKEKKTASIFLKNKNILESKKIEDFKTDGIKLSLGDIFSLAFKNNLQIKQNQNEKTISKLDIEEVKNSYKPQVDIFSNYTQIDDDRARYSNGLNAEKTIDSGIRLSQLIFSNDVIQNIKIRKLLAVSKADEVKALDDEVMYRSTLVYLNIIRSFKYVKIIKSRYDFIEQNLELAKQRVNIGVRDRSDVYRWQSELANAQIELQDAKKEYNSLKIELANILQLENDFSFIEYGMNSELFKLLEKDAIKSLGQKSAQDYFSQKVVHSHARLKQLNNLQKAKKEELSLNKKSRYMPTVAFEGSAKKIINRHGEGSSFNRPWDDEEVQAVVNINIPLYEGGVKSTRIQRNEIELINLKLQYKDTKNEIIENVKKNFESLKSSYEKISLSKVSQEAARKNFELIQDKYKNGNENIISLLDAQNSYIVSKLNQNISIIEYLSDLSAIYFFSGNIDILIDENKKEEVEKTLLEVIKGNIR